MSNSNKIKLTPILENMGAIEDDFEKKWRTGITADELKARVSKHIAKLPWKNNSYF